jgi:hypothetical protein
MRPNPRLPTKPVPSPPRLIPAVLLLVLAGSPPPGDAFELPEKWDSFAEIRAVNMKIDAGAKGDGQTDDTAAFQSVLEAGKGHRHPRFGPCREIYIPAGTYLLSDAIAWGDKRKRIRGAGIGRTILRLRDEAPGFGDPDNPKTWLDTKGEQFFAQNFGQVLQGLTLEVGAGNPGAIALEYHTNNTGYLMDLAIRAADPQKRGVAGLALTKGPGPGLVFNVAIDGFDVGILSRSGLHSMTLGKIALSNQRVCGIRNIQQYLFISHLTSDNRVPAIVQGEPDNPKTRGGFVTLNTAELKSPDSDTAAILSHDGTFVVRNLKTAGYSASIQTRTTTVDEPDVERFVHPADKRYTLFGDADVPNMPVALPPFPEYESPNKWAAVTPDDDGDITANLQAAIDSGARTVFVARAGTIRDTVVVRNNVERILGFFATCRTVDFHERRQLPKHPFWKNHNLGRDRPLTKPVFRIADGAPAVVAIEGIYDSYGSAGWGVDPVSSRTFIGIGCGNIVCKADTRSGKVFALDVGGAPQIFRNKRAWVWQVNTESYQWEPQIANDGGLLWICGHKTEKDSTNIGTFGGGWTELNGGFWYKNRQRVGQRPSVVVEDSTFSGSWAVWGKPYDIQALERRDGREKRLLREASGGWIPLYEAVDRESLERHLPTPP